jgi:asparagine synthase (glutamine-hydrolysing)
MVDSSLGLSLVFNGCIYNYKQLRAELESYGHRFFSTSDTEVIGKAYAHWALSCVDHFLEMFAFAIFEHETGKLILGRTGWASSR